jgi:ubiquinone/menaquinone biosynthesis C-methylase UbiE
MDDEIARARRYYDGFASTYERLRDGRSRYHDLIDDLEIELSAPYTHGRDVLEVGCGTGLLLRRFAVTARTAIGVDLSPAMVAIARERGLDARVGDALALPFADESFDLVVSFKVLPHVPSLLRALREVARVLRPGGTAIIELYNPHSLRGILRRFGPATRVASGTDRDVLCRYDDRRALIAALPDSLSVTHARGIRTLLPAAVVLELPWIGPALEHLERRICDRPLATHFGGFVCYVLTKHTKGG